MIRNSFCLLNGIGEKMERRLWECGVLTWEEFLSTPVVAFLSPPRKTLYNDAIERATERLSAGDAAYFAAEMDTKDHWRLFDEFDRETVCIDIETNGFGPDGGGYTTMVGMYDRDGYHAFVRGVDLSLDALRERLAERKLLVTYFGSSFDIPFLGRTMGDLRLDIPHFDLCHGARKIGLKGGLKTVERLLGIERPEAVQGMDGYAAVALWERARRGDDRAMELLITYNREDTINLMHIARIVYSRLRASTGIEDYIHAHA